MVISKNIKPLYENYKCISLTLMGTIPDCEEKMLIFFKAGSLCLSLDFIQYLFPDIFSSIKALNFEFNEHQQLLKDFSFFRYLSARLLSTFDFKKVSVPLCLYLKFEKEIPQDQIVAIEKKVEKCFRMLDPIHEKWKKEKFRRFTTLKDGGYPVLERYMENFSIYFPTLKNEKCSIIEQYIKNFSVHFPKDRTMTENLKQFSEAIFAALKGVKYESIWKQIWDVVKLVATKFLGVILQDGPKEIAKYFLNLTEDAPGVLGKATGPSSPEWDRISIALQEASNKIAAKATLELGDLEELYSQFSDKKTAHNTAMKFLTLSKLSHPILSPYKVPSGYFENPRPMTKQQTRTPRTRYPHRKPFPWTPIRHLMKDAGGNLVARDAVDLLIKHLETRAAKITQEANEITKHSKRKRVTKADIDLAIKF